MNRTPVVDVDNYRNYLCRPTASDAAYHSKERPRNLHNSETSCVDFAITPADEPCDHLIMNNSLRTTKN